MVKALIEKEKWINTVIGEGADVKSDQNERSVLEDKIKELESKLAKKSKFIHLRVPNKLLEQIDEIIKEEKEQVSRNQWIVDGLESLCAKRKKK